MGYYVDRERTEEHWGTNMWVKKSFYMWGPLAPAAKGNASWIRDKLNCWACSVFLAHKIMIKVKSFKEIWFTQK